VQVLKGTTMKHPLVPFFCVGSCSHMGRMRNAT